MIRQPIIAILAHVDHGKTTLLDQIRKSTVAAKEAGGITQCVDATCIPLSVVKELSGDILAKTKKELAIPGLVFIDTPGHESFTSLRERGGSIADLVVLVVDVMQGVQPQTRESIDIIRNFKVPFVVVANKIDLIPGWENQKTYSFLESLTKQAPSVQEDLNNRIYELIGQLSYIGFDIDLFSKVSDYTKKVAVIPVSAETGEGISELLMVLSGMAQKYLEDKLKLHIKGEAKGTVLEVKDVKGMGRTLDVILYDGTLREGDTIVIGGVDKPIVTKIRALLLPKPLVDTRESVSKFDRVKEVAAAYGVKISAPGLDDVIAGMPIIAAKDIEKTKEIIQKQIKDITIDTEKEGIVIRADSLGSLEAMIRMLEEKRVPIRKAKIGEITKADIIEAKNVRDKENTLGTIFGFNVNVLPDAKKLSEDYGIKIFIHDVIYKIFEDYEKWKEELLEKEKKQKMENLSLPAKIRIIPGHVFRQSKPAIVGIEVIGGTIIKGVELIDASDNVIGKVKELQEQSKSVSKGEYGSKLAASIEGAVVGRTINEGDELYTNVPREDFRTLTNQFKQHLSETDLQVLRELLKIKQKKDPMWGM
jgi:translation initiation factor 5B